MSAVAKLEGKGYRIVSVKRFTAEDMALKTITVDGQDHPTFPPDGAMYRVEALGPLGKIASQCLLTQEFERDSAVDVGRFVKESAAERMVALVEDAA